ncbi:MAG: peptidoglycan-binding protein [bacterium]|nr:peptidoglycan-binding protein [bacterium]
MRKYFTGAILALSLIVAFGTPAVAQTTATELQAKIAILMAQIAALQAQIQALPPQTTTTSISPKTSTSCAFYRDLTVGTRGEDISCLQNKLISEGYLEAGNNSGYFGMFTKAAVAKWQVNRGVNATGYFGTLSRGQFNTSSSLPIVPTILPVPPVVTLPPERSSILTVISPNGGETWAKGSSQLIKWSTPGCQYDACGANPATHDIKLQPQNTCAPGMACIQQIRAPFTITQNVYGTSFNWIVAQTHGCDPSGTRISDDCAVPDGTYTIEVCQSGTSICDSSDSYFKITSDTISDLIITTSSPLNKAQVGEYYSVSFYAKGLTEPSIGSTFYLAKGSLPPGITFISDLNCNTLSCVGTIGGTPSEAGTYSFLLLLSEGDNTRLTTKQFDMTVVGDSRVVPTVSASRGGASPSGNIYPGQKAELFHVDVHTTGNSAYLSSIKFDLNGTAVPYLSNLRVYTPSGTHVGDITNLTNVHSWFYTGQVSSSLILPQDSYYTLVVRGEVSPSVWDGVSDCPSCSKWMYMNLTNIGVGEAAISGLPVSGHSVYIPYSNASVVSSGSGTVTVPAQPTSSISPGSTDMANLFESMKQLIEAFSKFKK